MWGGACPRNAVGMAPKTCQSSSPGGRTTPGLEYSPWGLRGVVMRFVGWFCLGLCLAWTPAAAFAQKKQKNVQKNVNIAPTEPLAPEEQLKHFQLPPGFMI